MINKIKERWRKAKIQARFAEAETLLQMGIDEKPLGYSFDISIDGLEDEGVRKDAFLRLKSLADAHEYQISESVVDQRWHIHIEKPLMLGFVKTFKAKNPSIELVMALSPEVNIKFPAQHPATGDLQVWNDNDKLIVSIGDYYRCHFEDKYIVFKQGTPEEGIEDCVNSTITFVEEFLADKLILCVKFSGEKVVSSEIENHENLNSISKDVRKFVWSGPIE